MLIITTGSLDLAPLALPDIWQVHHHPQEDGFFNTIVDMRPALVLLDGDARGWQQRAHALKTSPATRRVPLMLASDDPQVLAEAPKHGVDYPINKAELLRDGARWLKEAARQDDPAAQEALLCDCAEPLPPRAREGIAKFNAGEYYAQHDLFEAQWVETERPVRDLYRAILQVGVAYYQIERGNYRGALKMLQRSVQWLLPLPDVCQGVDVRALREDAFRVRAELLRLGEARFAEFDRTLIKGVRLLDDTP